MYPVSNGIPRFVKSDGYVSSFSFEWDKHSRTLLDSVSGCQESERAFFEQTGFSEDDIKGKLVLDVGCGSGRFIEVVVKHGAKVIGIDMSFSVDRAYANVGHLPNVAVVQADLMTPPFRDGSFDAVFSLGVLHHTPNPERAFQAISRLVKANGRMAVWVYARDGVRQRLYNTVAACYRMFTTKIPHEALYRLCGLAGGPLYALHRSRIGCVTRALLPTSLKPLPEWRILDAYDWYSAKYQSKHTYEEVEDWFKCAGFRDIKRLPFPTSVKGTKE